MSHDSDSDDEGTPIWDERPSRWQRAKRQFNKSFYRNGIFLFAFAFVFTGLMVFSTLAYGQVHDHSFLAKITRGLQDLFSHMHITLDDLAALGVSTATMAVFGAVFGVLVFTGVFSASHRCFPDSTDDDDSSYDYGTRTGRFAGRESSTYVRMVRSARSSAASIAGRESGAGALDSDDEAEADAAAERGEGKGDSGGKPPAATAAAPAALATPARAAGRSSGLFGDSPPPPPSAGASVAAGDPGALPSADAKGKKRDTPKR